MNQIKKNPDFDASSSFIYSFKQKDNQKIQLQAEINKVDSEIEAITNSKFTVQSFQTTFKDLSIIYPRLLIDTKRRLNKLIFSEITSTINKKMQKERSLLKC